MGAVLSLWDKELQKELCREPLGVLLYAIGGEGTTLRGNHAGLRTDGAQLTRAMVPERRRVEVSLTDARLILEGRAIRGSAEVCVILPHDRKEVQLRYRYRKEATTEMEAVYVSFPLRVEESARVLSDSHIGWVDWQEGVLPGACREWLPLQTSILVREKGCHIQIASPEAFLFTVNSPVMGKWRSDLNVRGGQFYSYVMNNYWHTNYLGEQGGEFRFSYSITSAPEIPLERAYRFGWAHRQGLMALRMSYQEFRRDVP